MTLGDIIKAYRAEHRESLRSFASRAGLSYTYISMLEKNENFKTGKPPEPSSRAIIQSARAMGMRISEIVDRMGIANEMEGEMLYALAAAAKEDSYPTPEQMAMRNELIQSFEQLSPQSQRMLLAQAKTMLQIEQEAR